MAGLTPHDREAYCTKITPIGPAESDCPLWKGFLQRVTAENPGLQEYLQRVAGYSLTGLVNEHAMFFLYGTGANGKSVFLNALLGILGPYGHVAQIEMLMATKGDRHPTEIAAMRGARLVTATETDKGRRWAQAKVQHITGGEKIRARFMRQDSFEYMPQFKLVVAGNHRPALRSVDEAIRRRFNLLPFTVTIPEGERDLQLGEKLKAEYPAILQWAIDGCLAWQREGLNPPDCVRLATTDYLQEENATERWLDECCDLHPNYKTAVASLYESWKTWAEAAGEYVESRKAFSQSLEREGFTRDRSNAARFFRGIALKD